MGADDKFCDELKEILFRLPAWRVVFRLLDLDPNVFFFVKNKQKRFLWMNTPLRMLHGIKDESGFLDKTDYDYSSPDLAFLYQKEDDRVMEQREEIVNQPWIVNNKYGEYNWYISSKIPLCMPEDAAFGLAGIMRNVTREVVKNPLNEFRDVVEYIFRNYHRKFNVGELASMIYLSVSQFERKFATLFRMTPVDFILKVRIDSSVRLLIDTDCSVTEVAQRCGFYDNSHLTRLFKRTMGMTPLEFRKKYSSTGNVMPRESR